MELKIAEVSDIEATLKLHAKYQIDGIAEEDKVDGFVTTAFTKEELTELIVKEQGLFLVKKDEEVLAYVMAASWHFWSKWAMFEEMINDLKNLKYMGKTLSVENSYQYGPVCLDKSIRGTGILEKIFNFAREMMSQKYPILVTFVNKKNSRSFEAHHRKLGLEVIQEFTYNGNDYYEMVYDTSVALTGKGLIAMIDSPIEHLPYSTFFDEEILHDKIYANMHQHYYWSDDFSAEYYVAQAQAGFIAVSMKREGTLYLTPEIQKEYALLDFENLHVSKKVKKLIKSKNLKIEILEDFHELAEKIQEYHTFCWFNKAYVQILHEVNELAENCKVIGVLLKDGEKMVAGEVGYVIGRTYTSLTGFSSREKAYRNYGTAQLVLLSQYLEENGFEFLNLGQPYMQYKLDLGAEVYDRHEFLNRWHFASRKINKE